MAGAGLGAGLMGSNFDFLAGEGGLTRGQTMANQLMGKYTGHSLNTKGEGNVLHGGSMAHLYNLGQQLLHLLLSHALRQFLRPGGRITQTG